METKIGRLLTLFESGTHRSFRCDHQTKKRSEIGLDILDMQDCKYLPFIPVFSVLYI